jgi:hypothetical protein
MREILQQALDFCQYARRDISLNQYALEQLETTIEALEAELAKPDWTTDTSVPPFIYINFKEDKPEQDHGFDRTASHMAGEYVDTNQQNVNTSAERVQKSDKNVHEQGITHGDKVSLTVDDVGQIHVSPEQEPVAWQNLELPMEFYEYEHLDPMWHHHYRPLYTSPPRKEWKGLSDQDIVDELSEQAYGSLWVEFARRIESKLRKNNA